MVSCINLLAILLRGSSCGGVGKCLTPYTLHVFERHKFNKILQSFLYKHLLPLYIFVSLCFCYGIGAIKIASMANNETLSSRSPHLIGSSVNLSDDPTSKYYLHHGDSPGAILVSQPLVGDNYHT